jgi:hypothetical protein
MIGRMIAPAAQMMLLYRPKFKFLRFQMTVNTITHLGENQPMKPDFKSDPQAEMLIQIAPAIQKLVVAVTSN